MTKSYEEEVRAKLFDKIKEKAPVLNKAEILGIMLVVDEALSLQRKRTIEIIENMPTRNRKLPDGSIEAPEIFKIDLLEALSDNPHRE